MNDNHRTALQAHVEQAIAIVAASWARKAQMREELLGHLFDLYDEELARNHDAQTALAASLRRFGVINELQKDLKASVPIRARTLPHPGQ